MAHIVKLFRMRFSKVIHYFGIISGIIGHTLDLDLQVSRSEPEIALSQEWDGRLTWNENDMSHRYMTIILTNMIMLGWADAVDSELGWLQTSACRRHVQLNTLTVPTYSISQELCTRFFAVLCCGYTLTDFPISIRLTSLALWQSNDCPSASKATLMNMEKYFMWIHYERLHNHNKAKHNKTVCIFIGIYCRLL